MEAIKYDDEAIAVFARAAHEVNRAYCRALGDNSQPSWEEAPQWQKDSAMAGVRHTIANPNAKPSASHESWLAQKRAEGWTYGPDKDPVKKTHPCFLPYDELPPHQKAKDYIFLAVVLECQRAVDAHAEPVPPVTLDEPHACPTCKRPPPGYEYVGAAVAKVSTPPKSCDGL